MSQPAFADHASKLPHARREPLAAGFFGQRGSIEAHVAENRAQADCPSLDEFEDRYGHSELPRSKGVA